MSVDRELWRMKASAVCTFTSFTWDWICEPYLERVLKNQKFQHRRQTRFGVSNRTEQKDRSRPNGLRMDNNDPFRLAQHASIESNPVKLLSRVCTQQPRDTKQRVASLPPRRIGQSVRRVHDRGVPQGVQIHVGHPFRVGRNLPQIERSGLTNDVRLSRTPTLNNDNFIPHLLTSTLVTQTENQ